MVTVFPATSMATGSPWLLAAIGTDRTAIVLGRIPDGIRPGSSPERRLAGIFPRTRLLVEGGVQAAPVAGPLAGLDRARLAVADEHHPGDPGELTSLDD